MTNSDYIFLSVMAFLICICVICVFIGRRNNMKAVAENKRIYAEYLDMAQKKNEEFQAKQLSLLTDIRSALTDIAGKLGK